MRPPPFVAALALPLALATVSFAADPGNDFFEKKVRPVLVEHCLKCHSADPRKRKGGLALDSRAAMLKGGASGPAVVPGKPDESLLIQAVRQGGELKMPPKAKLPAVVIADLEKWVGLGAPAPAGADSTGGRNFWAYQPPHRLPVPAVTDRDWPRTDIDHFLLARLEANGLRPAPDADRGTLLRRATFDLIGLPPSPEEIDAFVNDPDPDAYERLIDRLLASPHYGERWGRHWLDVARYADSSGGGRSLLFKDAWRYRDYVVEAFNGDRPYDQFVREQVAGDLLPAASLEERRRQLIGTAFLALGPTNYERQDKDALEMDAIDEQLDTLGRAFLGQTLGCARCHDHKFDPIPTRDYYALAGIFKSTKTLIHDNVSRWVDVPLPLPPAREKAVAEHERAVAALREKVRLAKEAAKKSAGAADSARLEEELKKLEAGGPVRPTAMGVAEAAKVGDTHVCVRGVLTNRGESVPRGFLRAATVGRAPVIAPGASGRRELADWLASADNPLTARVMVNRVWHHLFGAGLVRTVDLFGATGEPPSHPELLDHLALQFVRDGWSVKRLVRSIVLSRAYRMSSAPNQPEAPAREIDPDNRLLSHANRKRLEAECLRDAMLVVSGTLDLTGGGPAMKKGTVSEIGYAFDGARRGVYLPVFRNQLPGLFEVFDFADPNLVTGRRTTSTVPTQALYLMNNPFVMGQAREAARRALAEPGDDAARVTRAYRAALGRAPTRGEREVALRFVAAREGAARQAAWERLYQALFACIDFRYLN